jgi:hypothetical protein
MLEGCFFPGFWLRRCEPLGRVSGPLMLAGVAGLGYAGFGYAGFRQSRTRAASA